MAEFEAPGGFLRRLARDATANPIYKLLSLVFAIAAWTYVQGGQLTEAKVRASVDWNLPPALSTTEPLPATVTLSVQGTRATVRRAQRADVRMTADVSTIEVGEHSLEFASLDVKGLPPAVSVTGYSPASVRMTLDKETTRKVKIEPVIVGDPAPGYSVVKVSLDPSVVEVVGPGQVAQGLKQLSTKPIDVSGLSSDLEGTAEPDLPWGFRATDNGFVRARIEIEPVVEARTVDHIPVLARDDRGRLPAWNAEIPEVQVTLQGPAKLLRDLDAADLVVWAHLPTNAARDKYNVPFGPPEGVRLSVAGLPPDLRVTGLRPDKVEVSRAEP